MGGGKKDRRENKEGEKEETMMKGRTEEGQKERRMRNIFLISHNRISELLHCEPLVCRKEEEEEEEGEGTEIVSGESGM